MGILSKATQWVSEKSERFVRGRNAAEQPQRFGDQQQSYEQEPGEGEAVRQPMDPFGNGDDKYGGRQPYRSQQELEQEAARQREYQQAYQQQAYQQQAYQQQPQYQQAYQQPAYQQPQAQQQPAYQQPQPVYRQPQPVYQQPQAQQPAYQQQAYAQDQGNVVPFPSSAAENAYTHVEYIVFLRNRDECRRVISYMKADASVFLNMEFIASDSDRQRCVDMLSGAAYTLGCNLSKLSASGIYLISAACVKVVHDSSAQGYGEAASQDFVRQRYEDYRPQEDAYRPAAGFSSGSPTSRFQAQAGQQPPASFGSVMAGGYGAAGRYARRM